MKKTAPRTRKALVGSAMVMAVTASVFAQEKPFAGPGTGQPPPPAAPSKPAATAATPVAAPSAAQPAAEPQGIDKFFNGQIPDVFARGKFNLNARLRYEFVDLDDGAGPITEDSHAPTVRTRFGFTTAPLYGVQGMIEGENVTALGSRANYNAAGSNGRPFKPPVADPPVTEINQAWLSYSYEKLLMVKGGRQRLALDNHRFVGDVGWRQNMQTFDAVALDVKPMEELSVYYAYLWNVHRIFGGVSGLSAPFTDFSSDSHLVNVSYAPCAFGRFVGYAYLLDLKNVAGPANSCVTYGGYFAGSAPVTDQFTLGYRAEFAWQTEYADAPASYEAEYYNVEVSGTIKPVAFGLGYEVLGSDNGMGFKTPLATLHAFNGWADVFLNTPVAGLRDLYAFAQVTLPAQIPLRVVYHKFDPDSGSGDYGQEFDVVVSKRFGKNWTAMLKYAYYMGEDAAPPALTLPDVDKQVFWAQVEFNY